MSYNKNKNSCFCQPKRLLTLHCALWSTGCIRWYQETPASPLKMRLWWEIISSPNRWDTQRGKGGKLSGVGTKAANNHAHSNKSNYNQVLLWNKPGDNILYDNTGFRFNIDVSKAIYCYFCIIFHRRCSTCATTVCPMMRIFSLTPTSSSLSDGSEEQRRSPSSTHSGRCHSVLESGRVWADGWLSLRCISSCPG